MNDSKGRLWQIVCRGSELGTYDSDGDESHEDSGEKEKTDDKQSSATLIYRANMTQDSSIVEC